MTIESTHVGKAVVIKVIGSMDGEKGKELEAAWDMFMKEGSLLYVLNFSELNYINSAGIVSVLRNSKLTLEKGGTVRLCGLQGLVRELFEMTRLIKVFQVYDSVEAACQNFA